MTILFTGGDKPLGGWTEYEAVTLEEALWEALYGSLHAHWCACLETGHDVPPDCDCK